MAQKLALANLSDLPEKVSVPSYARADLSAGIVHIGVGNFHRAHQAVYLDRLFEMGRDHDWAIVGAGIKSFDVEKRAALKAQDWLTTVVELDDDGRFARVTGAMIDFLEIDPQVTIAALSDRAIRIVSLTVTEGGYYVDARSDGFDATHSEIEQDARNIDAPQTVFGILIAALKARRDAGVMPFTIMSCDNLPGNGDVARQAVLGLAGLADTSLATWIRENVAFPNGMVDCITPATTAAEVEMVCTRIGIDDAAPVNCEPFRQWVLEDNFPAGRPALEHVGVEFVSDVHPHELMKLRILNGGHAAIAYVGSLLGHTFVHEAMADEDIRQWYLSLAKCEIIPTLHPIKGVDYQKYLSTCVDRFSNFAVKDRIARLCLDGSNRQPKFILPTVHDALTAGRPVAGLALEVALWCKFCAISASDATAPQVEDQRADELMAAATAAMSRPAAFLEISDVFGDLSQNTVFATAFTDVLGQLWQRETRAVIQQFQLEAVD
ncbi:MAG: mannitol 2-dehydrogenase [Yoonia sp.]|jgi:mannitol 2-dehydrogenase